MGDFFLKTFYFRGGDELAVFKVSGDKKRVLIRTRNTNNAFVDIMRLVGEEKAGLLKETIKSLSNTDLLIYVIKEFAIMGYELVKLVDEG